MGNSIQKNSIQKNSIQKENNLILIKDNLYNSNVVNIKSIMDNSVHDFSGLYEGFSIYHYLILFANRIDIRSLREICDILYDNRHRFGSYYLISKPKFKWVRYRNNNVIFTHSSERSYNEFICKVQGLDPLHLCLELQTHLSNNDKYLIIISLLNKLKSLKKKPKSNQVEPQLFNCGICFTKDKNMLLKPCNHLVCCDICIDKLTNCPLCRTTIISREKIYV